jgi:hypothetical protein
MHYIGEKDLASDSAVLRINQSGGPQNDTIENDTVEQEFHTTHHYGLGIRAGRDTRPF